MTGSPPRTGVWFLPDRPAPELLAVIQQAERSGLDEVWLGDEGPAREPFTVLTAAATTTTRIRLGIGITNPYVRHPGLAVTTMATIAELGGDRVVLGVGAGGSMSLRPFELTAEEPVAAITAFLELARAAREGREVEGYRPSNLAFVADLGEVPVYVGGRGPRLNRLASSLADGAFVAGMAPFRYDDVIAWARSTRAIDIALYPSVAFDEAGIERHRPEMIWSLLDAPAAVRDRVDLAREDVRTAAEAMREGDPGPARSLITDQLLEQLMVIGDPAAVGRRLARLVGRHRPTSIGLALVQDDLGAGVEAAREAFTVMRAQLEDS